MDRFLNSYANKPLENLASAPFLVDFIVSSLIVVLLTLFIAIKINRPTTWVYYGVTDIIFIVAFLFGMDILTIVDSPLHHGRVHHLLLHQLRFLRKYIAIPLKNTKTKFKTESKEYDKEKFIKDVCTAVNWLSKNKVGALITIEKKTPLDDFIENGTLLNAPSSRTCRNDLL